MTNSWTLARARASWWHKQALAGTSKRPLGALIGDSGWLRTLGGADAYLAARARRPGMTRAALDAAVAAGELRVHPAVRGCIYLVPAAAVPDLLALNAETWRTQTEKELAKVGKTMKLVEGLAPGVLTALTQPMTTDAIRKAMPGIPSFGEAGKKVGLSSPLPLALRLLEFAGKIERTLDGGRLDTERYLWRRTAAALPPPAPDREARIASVVEAFLGFAGPATLAQISAWSGHPQRDLKTAIARLDAAPVTVEGLGEAYVRRADLAAVPPPPPRGTALVGLEDNYLNNHGVAAVTDPRHHALDIDLWGGTGKAAPLGKANHMLSRSIVVDGQIAGFWEVDPRTAGAVWHTFDPAPPALARALDELTAATAAFLLDELGHARVFSLDTMDDVQTRADRIARLGEKPAGTGKPVTRAKAGRARKPRSAPRP